MPTHSPDNTFKTLPTELNFLAPIVIDDLVRLGGANVIGTNDGGYIIPQRVLTNADFLISMGISHDWKFEEEWWTRGSLQGIHAYDHTVSDAFFSKEIYKSLIRLARGKSSLKEIASQRKLLTSYRSFFSGT